MHRTCGLTTPTQGQWFEPVVGVCVSFDHKTISSMAQMFWTVEVKEREDVHNLVGKPQVWGHKMPTARVVRNLSYCLCVFRHKLYLLR